MWACLAVHHSTLLFTFQRYYFCFYQFPFPRLLTVETVTCVRDDMADIMTAMPHADRNIKRCLDVGLNRNQPCNTQTLPGFLLQINGGTWFLQRQCIWFECNFIRAEREEGDCLSVATIFICKFNCFQHNSILNANLHWFKQTSKKKPYLVYVISWLNWCWFRTTENKSWRNPFKNSTKLWDVIYNCERKAKTEMFLTKGWAVHCTVLQILWFNSNSWCTG